MARGGSGDVGGVFRTGCAVTVGVRAGIVGRALRVGEGRVGVDASGSAGVELSGRGAGCGALPVMRSSSSRTQVPRDTGRVLL